MGTRIGVISYLSELTVWSYNNPWWTRKSLCAERRIGAEYLEWAVKRRQKLGVACGQKKLQHLEGWWGQSWLSRIWPFVWCKLYIIIDTWLFCIFISRWWWWWWWWWWWSSSSSSSSDHHHHDHDHHHDHGDDGDYDWTNAKRTTDFDETIAMKIQEMLVVS